MRHLSSASLAAAIALAFATGAGAAATTSGKPSIANLTSAGTFVSSAPRIPGGQSAAASSGAGTGTSTSTTATPPSNTTSVDVRNQQTMDAVAVTHASGSTSSLGPLAGASSVNGTTTGTGTTVGSTGVLPFAVAPFGTADVTSSGALAASTTPTLASNGVFASDVYGMPVLSANVVTAEPGANDASVNRAIRQVQRDRARIGRNGQLLYSIAPRTNVDRSNEMPDDGPSPALSGYNSALAR